jgi:hypothetical protein
MVGAIIMGVIGLIIMNKACEVDGKGRDGSG